MIIMKHNNSDCDYKKYRDTCEGFVFEIAFKLEFEYFSELFHRFASFYTCAPACSTKISLREGSNTFTSSIS